MPRLILGVLLGVTITCAAFFFLQMTVPLDERSLNSERLSELRPFIHKLESVSFGYHNTDDSSIYFSFQTSIPSPDQYFAAVTASIASEWKLIEDHKTFRSYANTWSPSFHGEKRSLVFVTYWPDTHKVVLYRQEQNAPRELKAQQGAAANP